MSDEADLDDVVALLELIEAAIGSVETELTELRKIAKQQKATLDKIEAGIRRL